MRMIMMMMGFNNPRVVKWNGMLWICPEPYHRGGGTRTLIFSPLRRGSRECSESRFHRVRSGDWYSKYWTFNCTPIEQLNVCERQNTRTNGQHGLITLSGPFLFSFPFPFPFAYTHILSPIPSAIPITVLQAVLKKGVVVRKKPKLLRARFVAQFKWLEKVQNY